MNYGQIKAALAFYTTRSDVTANIDLIMPLVNQRIYYGETSAPALRVSAMLRPGTSFTMPDDWLEMRGVTSGGPALDYIPHNEFVEYTAAGGLPVGYTVDNRTLSIGPNPPGSTVAYTYYAKFPELVDDADENWISVNAPNLYISGYMIEWAKKTRDDALGIREAANYTSSITSLMSQDRAAQISGSTLRRTGPFGRRPPPSIG